MVHVCAETPRIRPRPLRARTPSPTLSGGEAERIKLAAELAAPGNNGVAAFDKPLKNLEQARHVSHVQARRRLFQDVERPPAVERNLDVACAADCIISDQRAAKLGAGHRLGATRARCEGSPVAHSVILAARAGTHARRSKEQVAARTFARASKQSSSSVPVGLSGLSRLNEEHVGNRVLCGPAHLDPHQITGHRRSHSYDAYDT
jgi:hypothetical protein